MHRLFAILAGLGCLAFATWFAVAETPRNGITTIPVAAVSAANDNCLLPQISGDLEFQGSLSCTNATCHGNSQRDVRPGRIRRDEFFIWSERDPHAKAYQSLVDDWTSDRSKSIAKKLGIKSMSDPQFANCLACHSPNRSLSASVDHSQPSSSPFLSAREGVGCEACHGPSQRWRAKHYRADWNEAEAAASGKLSTKGNLLARARMCAECHVGSKNREVNHDMIAAGHPPLRFEMTAYSDMMPSHWDDPADGEFKLQVWAAGQIASADAALELLEARAAKTSPQPVWPEFAEFACFQCHHDLNAGKWRPDRKYNDENLASPKWGEWYFSLLHAAAKDDGAFAQTLSQLQTSLSGYSPDRAAVQKNAAAARMELYKWTTANGKLQTLGSRDRLVKLVKDVAGEDASEVVAGWDTATQVYLALVALDFARPELNLRTNVRTLLKQINYSPGYNSPKDFAGAVSSEGSDANPRDRFHQELKKILNQL